MNLRKALVTTFLVAGAISSVPTAAMAATYYTLEDTDPGASTDQINSTPVFSLYSGGSGNQQHVSTYTNGTGEYFNWNLSIPMLSHTFTFEPYLYSDYASNRGAYYYDEGTIIGEINQFSAPGGYNYVGTFSDWSTAYIHLESYDYASAHPDSTDTVADAVEAYY